MYKTIGIEKLSDNQLSRLRNGHSVRVKLGSHHNIHLSVQQLKKLHSASKKAKHQPLHLTHIKKKHTD